MPFRAFLSVLSMPVPPMPEMAQRSFRKGTPLVKRLRITSILMSIVFVFLTNGSAQTNPRRVIIDTDPGVDDAMAILLALKSPELKIDALTVVPGNVEAAQGLENA